MIYAVNTRTYGVLLVTNDNIRAARRWAARALPGEVLGVSRYVAPRCSACNRAACVCLARSAKRFSGGAR